MSRVLLGRTAAQGSVAGHLHFRAERAARDFRPASGIVGAIAETLGQLRALQGRSDSIGVEILQFQVELLEDDILVRDMLDAAGAGAAPGAAIRDTLDVQAAALAGSGSERFAARAADIHDLRDRMLRVLAGTHGVAEAPGDGAILLCEELTPSQFLEIDWSRVRGAATLRGSIASHVALLARTRGVPLIVGVEGIDAGLHGRPALLDATGGRLVVDPEGELPFSAAPVAGLEDGSGNAMTPDGRRIEVHLTVDSLDTLGAAPAGWFDGIGLVRTELLLADGRALHDEAAQQQLYAPLFDWADGRPVTIRLIDAGGDKPIVGFTLDGESNPFLGVRGIRLLLRRPEILRAQLRAIVEAARERPARVLVPMVALPEEMAACRAMLRELGAPASVALGMMVETPAAAIDLVAFDSDFYAIGTNDLVQYVMAAARDGAELHAFHDRIAPAVATLIAQVVAHGRTTGRPVSVCGDAAASPPLLAELLGLGVTSISVPVRAAARAKRAIRGEG